LAEELASLNKEGHVVPNAVVATAILVTGGAMATRSGGRRLETADNIPLKEKQEKEGETKEKDHPPSLGFT